MHCPAGGAGSRLEHALYFRSASPPLGGLFGEESLMVPSQYMQMSGVAKVKSRKLIILISALVRRIKLILDDTR